MTHPEQHRSASRQAAGLRADATRPDVSPVPPRGRHLHAVPTEDAGGRPRIPETDPQLIALAHRRDNGWQRVANAEAALAQLPATASLERLSHRAELRAGRRESAEAMDELVRRGLVTARHVALRFRNTGVELEELEADARLGLVRAVKRFDPRVGEFVPFIVRAMMGEVQRSFRDSRYIDMDYGMRVPRAVTRDRRTAKRSQATLQQQFAALGKEPSFADIAEHSGLPEERVREVLDPAFGRPIRLDEPLRDSDTPLLDSVESPDGEGPYEIVEMAQDVRGIIDKLTDREKRIIFLRFFAGLPQIRIGEHVGISQMQVSRILGQTLSRIRADIEAGEGRGVDLITPQSVVDDIQQAIAERNSGNNLSTREEFADKVRARAKGQYIPDRDIEILYLADQGMTQYQIADELGVRQPTVSRILRRTVAKLGGLIEAPEEVKEAPVQSQRRPVEARRTAVRHTVGEPDANGAFHVTSAAAHREGQASHPPRQAAVYMAGRDGEVHETGNQQANTSETKGDGRN